MTLLEDPVSEVRATTAIAPTEVDVCAWDDLVPDRGVCALVDGRPVAVFRASAPGGPDELYAVGNVDPYSAASVLSRGIVGSVGDRAVVASPIFKNRFDLRTGESLDDPAVRLPVHGVRIGGGRVLVAPSPGSS
jgi:nitrite reductase (NADH) small subunit